MLITWRAVALTALGVVAVLLVPAGLTIVLWMALVVLLCVVDTLLAASPRAVELSRTVPKSVRLTERVTSSLAVTNLGRRTLRGTLRDAWQPSAGAVSNRHELKVRAGDGQRVRTVLMPSRRGDRQVRTTTSDRRAVARQSIDRTSSPTTYSRSESNSVPAPLTCTAARPSSSRSRASRG